MGTLQCKQFTLQCSYYSQPKIKHSHSCTKNFLHVKNEYYTK